MIIKNAVKVTWVAFTFAVCMKNIDAAKGNIMEELYDTFEECHQEL